jgi:hypothetical protein
VDFYTIIQNWILLCVPSRFRSEPSRLRKAGVCLTTHSSTQAHDTISGRPDVFPVDESRERFEREKWSQKGGLHKSHSRSHVHSCSFVSGWLRSHWKQISSDTPIHQQLSHRSRLTKKWALRGKTPWLSHMGIASRLWLSAVISHAFILTLSNNLCRRMGWNWIPANEISCSRRFFRRREVDRQCTLRGFVLFWPCRHAPVTLFVVPQCSYLYSSQPLHWRSHGTRECRKYKTHFGKTNRLFFIIFVLSTSSRGPVGMTNGRINCWSTLIYC